jgi:hypothetical protein
MFRGHLPKTVASRRLTVVLAIFAAVLLSVFITPQAQAVHDTGVFELDGNAVNDPAVAGQDWSDVYTAQSATPKACPTGASACSFVNDGASNASIFTGGGSKDPQDISAWAWKDQAGGLPDKDNLQDSFAARYTIPANATTCQNGTSPPTGDCSLLYFGSDRLDNSGDAQEGFWFFQNKITADPATGKFVGVHKTGDLLILSDFSNGGGTSTINIYKWVGSGGDTNGTLDFLAGGNASKCGGSANDPFCGIVNPANGTTSPWPFTDKSGNSTFLNGEFYEGGVNLSDPSINLGGECFASLASETRSSTSPTATLKDFVLGGFGACTSSLASAQDWLPNDTATASVGGKSTWTGTIAFALYPGLACGGTALYTESAQNVSNASASASTHNTTVKASASGDFSWKVDFHSTTSGVPDSSICKETSSLTISNG